MVDLNPMRDLCTIYPMVHAYTKYAVGSVTMVVPSFKARGIRVFPKGCLLNTQLRLFFVANVKLVVNRKSAHFVILAGFEHRIIDWHGL